MWSLAAFPGRLSATMAPEGCHMQSHLMQNAFLIQLQPFDLPGIVY